MTSEQLQRRYNLNPSNLPRVHGAPAMSPHDYAAARFEAEGRRAYPDGANPYNPGTMAYDRFAAGFEQFRKAGSVLVAQYDLTTGRKVYWRMIRRDFVTGCEHVLCGWLEATSEQDMRKRAVGNLCELIERKAC